MDAFFLYLFFMQNHEFNFLFLNLLLKLLIETVSYSTCVTADED